MRPLLSLESAPVTSLAEAMIGADFVVIDDEVFEAEYLRVPDEFTAADDVVLEATRGDAEVDLTRAEIDGAQHVGEGVFRLRSGIHLQFLTGATIHYRLPLLGVEGLAGASSLLRCSLFATSLCVYRHTL